MGRKTIKALGVISLAIFLLTGLLCYLFVVEKMHWVGDKELVVQFVVVDSANGEPLKGARISVQQESGGFCEDREKKSFDLHTNERGSVKKRCGECMCFGTRRRRFFEDWDEG